MKGAAVALLGVIAAAGFGVRAQTPETETVLPPSGEVSDQTAAQLSFSFVSRVSGQPAWTMTVRPDGSGSYTESAESSGSSESPADAASQPIQVDAVIFQRLDAGERAVRKGHCETRQKGIAQTGTKTLRVMLGPAPPTVCTFNYSDDDALNDAANAFLALAETLHEGAKLRHDHRFDRLALDADIDVLLGEIGDGRALEPRNIAAVLQSIVDDDRVIDRVRRKAARLLQEPAPASADKPR